MNTRWPPFEAVTKEIYHQITSDDVNDTIVVQKGNDEMLSDPTLDYAVTTLVPNMSGDEIKSEDTQMRTFSISGHTDNLTNDEENLKGFRQIQRRRSKNSISKMPPHEATEETNIWIFSGMFQKMKTTGISRSLG